MMQFFEKWGNSLDLFLIDKSFFEIFKVAAEVLYIKPGNFFTFGVEIIIYISFIN